MDSAQTLGRRWVGIDVTHLAPDSEQPLQAWYAMASKAQWRHFADVRQQFRNASAVGDRVVFNVKGNEYRLVVRMNYERQVGYVRFVGTHPEYDKLDVKNV